MFCVPKPSVSSIGQHAHWSLAKFSEAARRCLSQIGRNICDLGKL